MRLVAALALLGMAPAIGADFVERDLTVGQGEWAVSGTLTMPGKGKGPWPAAVLIHGSGPHDRDSTVGATKPFRDLAHGLAAKGVAVLRYDKRTYQHQGRLAAATEMTPKEEVFDDAAAAVYLLRKMPEVNGDRVFVIGHSMGATLAPRMAPLIPKLGGIVMLAASARPIADVVVEQIAYLRTQPENQSAEAQAKIAEIEQAAAKLKAIREDDAGFILGAPVSYWRWWGQYDPLGEAAKLELPVLILQGERDYQVTMTDFELWKKRLGGKANVTLKSYEDLNHLFVTGKGRSKPAEYMVGGKVAVKAVEEIAAWIRAR